LSQPEEKADLTPTQQFLLEVPSFIRRVQCKADAAILDVTEILEIYIVTMKKAAGIIKQQSEEIEQLKKQIPQTTDKKQT
jgi:hypothetical protein